MGIEYYFIGDPSGVHPRCGHNHASLVRLGVCYLDRIERGYIGSGPYYVEGGISHRFTLRPMIASFNQVLEVLEYRAYLKSGRAGHILARYAGELERVEARIDRMDRVNHNHGHCPLCGASANITCSKACAYNRVVRGISIHVTQFWWDMHRRTP